MHSNTRHSITTRHVRCTTDVTAGKIRRSFVQSV